MRQRAGKFQAWRRAVTAACVLAMGMSAGLAAQAGPQPGIKSGAKSGLRAESSAENAAAVSPAPNDREVAEIQAELIRLLRLSPTMTTVVARDPSLLADAPYVERNNPQLAAFLAAHPEVSRNPDFYLFTHLNHRDGEPDEALEKAVWPAVYRSSPPREPFAEFLSNLAPLIAFLGFLGVVLWLVRVFVENRRWTRVFRQQSEIHGKIIERFATNQELALYMETESGKRFLEAAPIPVNLEAPERVPNAVARVLTPLQIGVVMVLLGVGLISLRGLGPDMAAPMTFFGTVVLMPGIGFILSAGITWLLAAKMGLMPGANAKASSTAHTMAGRERL